MSESGDPPFDPLYLQKPLEHRIEFPVLGIPVRFATNDRDVLEVIGEVFGHWAGTVTGDPPSKGVDIRIFVQDGDEGPAPSPVLTFRAPDPLRWIVHTPGSVGLADLERLDGVAYVTRQLLSDRARFRVSILQFLVLIIVTIEDRTPVHAAMIARGDTALLLVGPAGSGKSTVAYAAAKAGWDVLSDDAAYVQLEPHRVWGSGPSLLLLAGAASRYPELAGMQTTLFPTGKRKLMVSPSTAGRRRWANRAGVCLLSRSGGPVQRMRIGPDDIRPLFVHDPSGAGRRFGDRLERAASWLSARGGWRLSLSDDPAEAIPILEQIRRDVEIGPA